MPFLSAQEKWTCTYTIYLSRARPSFHSSCSRFSVNRHRLRSHQPSKKTITILVDVELSLELSVHHQSYRSRWRAKAVRSEPLRVKAFCHFQLLALGQFPLSLCFSFFFCKTGNIFVSQDYKEFREFMCAKWFEHDLINVQWALQW